MCGWETLNKFYRFSAVFLALVTVSVCFLASFSMALIKSWIMSSALILRFLEAFTSGCATSGMTWTSNPVRHPRVTPLSFKNERPEDYGDELVLLADSSGKLFNQGGSYG